MIFIFSLFSPVIVLIAYREGLKHNYEMKNNIKPTSITNEIKEYKEEKEIKKNEIEFSNMINEYMYGEQNVN
jgi:hypothetical protein